MTQEGNIIELKVDGMDCANCAAGIDRYLTNKGLKEVFVNFATGEVQFSLANTVLQQEDVEKGIGELGYRIINEDSIPPWWTIERNAIGTMSARIFNWPFSFWQKCLGSGKSWHHQYGCVNIYWQYSSFCI